MEPAARSLNSHRKQMNDISEARYDSAPSLQHNHILNRSRNRGQKLKSTAPWGGVSGGRLTAPTSGYISSTTTCGT